ncbi:MAG TPA: type II toxin-antitoxin system VapC family toxin [Gemmataceae bacterium]|nr:type II toxin-antitoxin system VapC family toxin [Gemmataceae bacterium]
MNFFLFDGSALVKRYLPEPGKPLVDRLFAVVTRDRLLSLMIGGAEVAAAIARKRNGGAISRITFRVAMADLRAEGLNAADFTKPPADNMAINASIPLIDTHAINATDAVVLYVALQFAVQFRAAGDDLVLVACDRRLLRAAQAEGLLTFDPENQTQAELDVLVGP